MLSHARSSLLGIAPGESTSTTCPSLKPLPSCACPEIDHLLALLDICSALPRLTCELEHPLWEAPIQPSSRAHAAAFSSTPAHVLAFLPSFTARPCHSFSCRFLPASTLHFLCCSHVVPRPDLSLLPALARHWSASLAGAPSASPTTSPQARSTRRYSISR